GAVIAWHNETQRKAVEHGKIRSVHRISEHDITVARMIDIERLDEIGSLVGHGPVQTIERDLARGPLDAGLVENGLERHPLPARIAHGAVPQLSACDARVEESAAVASALVDRHDVDGRHLLDVSQR